MTFQSSGSLKQHPLSAAFPSMPESDLAVLSDDIEKHGQREKGVLYEGMVLDGWHRYIACSKAGVQFKSAEFDGEDPVAFVLSRNLHRRHLTASQRALAVVETTNWRPHGDQKSRSAAAADRTTAEMARAAEVSPRTIENAKAAHKAGLGEAVREGKVTAERAAEVAKLPPAKRDKALKEKSSKPKVVIADSKFEKLYEKVKAELVETKEALTEMTDSAAAAEVFKNKDEFKAMQNLQAELRAVKQRRGELMRELAEVKKDLAYWKKRAEKAEKK